MSSDLNMSQGKMSDFVSFLLFRFTLVIKLRNFDFESHWNTLIFFGRKRHGIIFEYVPLTYLNMFHIPLFLFTLVTKPWNFNFESHWNTLILFNKKNDVRCEYFLSNSIWFCLSFSALVEFWQRNTNFKFYWNNLLFFN